MDLSIKFKTLADAKTLQSSINASIKEIQSSIKPIKLKFDTSELTNQINNISAKMQSPTTATNIKSIGTFDSGPKLEGEISRVTTINKQNDAIKLQITLQNELGQIEKRRYELNKENKLELTQTTKTENTGLLQQQALIKKQQALIKKQQALIKKNAETYTNLNERIKRLSQQNIIGKKSAQQFNQELERVNKLTDEAEKKKGFAQLNQQISDSKKQVMGLGEQLKIAYQKFAIWSVATVSWYGVVRAIKNVITQVIELDTAFTKLQMITNSTDAEINNLKNTYISMAKELGVTVSTVVNAADEFLRAGLNAKDAAEALKASIVLSTIANMDSATSTQYLIAAMNAYNLEASNLIDVVDKLSAIDIVAATSSEELGEALSLSAKSAQLAGIELDKYLGMIATVSETTRQSASTIGNSFRTLFSRLQQVKIGALVDEEGEDISNVDRVLKQYGVDIMQVTNNLNDMGSLIDLLGEKWDKYTTAQKSEIATTVAGVRQRERFLVLMDEYDRALELEQVSLESSGSAMEKYAIYADSAQAKINALKSAWTELANDTLNSDIVKLLLDAGRGLAEFITKAGGLLNAIMSIGGGILIIKNTIALIKAQKVISNIDSVTKSMRATTLATNTAAAATAKLKIAFSSLVTIAGVVVAVISLIKSYNKKQKQSAIEAAEAQTAAIESQLESIESLRDEYIELNNISNKNDTQKNRILEITKALTEAYGSENEAVKRLKNSYGGTETAYKDFYELQKANLKQWLDLQGPAYEKAKKYLSNVFKEDVGKFYIPQFGKVPGLTTKQKSAIASYQALIDEYEKILAEFNMLEIMDQEFSKLSAIIYDFSNKTLAEQSSSYKEIQLQIKNLIALYPEYKTQIIDLTSTFNDLVSTIESTDFALTKLEEDRKALQDYQTQLEEELKTQEKLLKVEEARAALAKAERQRVKVFRQGEGYIFEQDVSAVSAAQKNLDNALQDAGLDSVSQQLSNIDTLIDAYNQAQLEQGKTEQDNLRAYFRDSNNLLEWLGKTFAEKLDFLNQFISGGYVAPSLRTPELAGKYANGTTNAAGGPSLVGEEGAEMRWLNKGDKIISANETRTLMSFSKNPRQFLKLNSDKNGDMSINIANVELPSVTNPKGFIDELVKIAHYSKPKFV